MGMIVGYSRPDDISWTIGGTGASIDTDQDDLTNGRPGAVTRFTWLSGTQTTSSLLTLDADWTDDIKPTVIAVLGITLPAGTLVKAQFPDGSGGWEDPPGGNFSQRVQSLPDGSNAVWMVVDPPSSGIDSLRLEFYNDVDGFADILAGEEFDIGEIWLSPSVELPLRPGYSVTLDDASRINESISHQVWRVERRTRRVLIGNLSGIEIEKMADGGLSNGEDLQTVANALSAAKPCVSIPKWEVNGTIDADILHRLAQFGYVPPGAGVIDHVSTEFFQGPWEHREIPAKELGDLEALEDIEVLVDEGTLEGTVTRSGDNATVWNSSGLIETVSPNTARFDYNPADNSFRGLLIEEGRTNSLQDPRDLSTGNWQELNSVSFAQDETGVDGGSNAGHTVSDNNATGQASIRQTVSVSDNSNPNVLFWYVKKDADESRFPEFRQVYADGTTVLYRVQVNTSDGSTEPAGGTDPSVIDVVDAGDWWQVILSGSNNGTGNTSLRQQQFPAVTATFDGSSENDATGSIVYDWGQIELNTSFATSPVIGTRSADDITETYSESVFSEAITFRFREGSSGTTQTIRAYDDGTTNNRIRLYRNASDEIHLLITDGGTEQADLNLGTVADDTEAQVAFRIKANDVAASLDGGTIQLDSSVTIPTVTTGRFGNNVGDEYLNGWIKEDYRENEAWVNSQLQSPTK